MGAPAGCIHATCKVDRLADVRLRLRPASLWGAHVGDTMDRDTMSPELEILYAARTTADDKCVAAKAVYMQHVYYGTTGTPASKAAAAAFRAAWAAWRLASAEYLDALAAVTPAHRTRYQETARQYRDMAA